MLLCIRGIVHATMILYLLHYCMKKKKPKQRENLDFFLYFSSPKHFIWCILLNIYEIYVFCYPSKQNLCQIKVIFFLFITNMYTVFSFCCLLYFNGTCLFNLSKLFLFSLFFCNVVRHKGSFLFVTGVL